MDIQLIKARVRSYDVKEYPNDYSKKEMWEHLKLFVTYSDSIEGRILEREERIRELEALRDKLETNLRIFASPLETIGDYQ